MTKKTKLSKVLLKVLFLCLITTFLFTINIVIHQQVFLETLVEQDFIVPQTGCKNSTSTTGAIINGVVDGSTNGNNDYVGNSGKLKFFGGERMMKWKKKHKTNRPQLQTLQCEKYYGGSIGEKESSEMVYWWKIPQDEIFVNSFQSMHAKECQEKYFIFEPDGAGWNNIRMSLETILIMGISMGRTIVLPPESRIYLFNRKAHKHHFTFRDFFNLEEAEIEHYHVKFVSMEKYLETVAMEGLLVDQSTKNVTFPPNNRTNWNQANGTTMSILWDYIRKTSLVDKTCKPIESISYFPSNSTNFGPESQERVMSLLQKALPTNRASKLRYWNQFNNNPTPANATELERLKEHLMKRKKVCFYNNEMQNALTIHYTFNWDDYRFLLPFYSFHFYENWKQELWTKRFVRDHLRYKDELMCAAARIVAELRKDAKSVNPENKEGIFHTVHIRRNDFSTQYAKSILSAEEMYEVTKTILGNHTSKMLYIATDEKNSTYFKPLKTAYITKSMSDYVHLIGDINPNYHPLIEQLILSRGDTFIGTHYSTFTSYVNRLRGYYSWRDKLQGYEIGTIKSYYFTHAKEKHLMYFSLREPVWAYEFPEAWLDIDNDVDYE